MSILLAPDLKVDKADRYNAYSIYRAHFNENKDKFVWDIVAYCSTATSCLRCICRILKDEILVENLKPLQKLAKEEKEEYFIGG